MKRTLYHGTSQALETFEHRPCTGADANCFSHLGLFFTPDEDLAATFARAANPAGGVVLTCEVEINRPAYRSVDDLFRWDDRAGGVVVACDMGAEREALLEQGYDAVIVEPATWEQDEALGLGGEFEFEQIVLLRPEQARVAPGA